MLETAKMKCANCDSVTSLSFSEIVTCEGCGNEKIIDSGLHMTMKIDNAFTELMAEESVNVSCYIYPFTIQKLEALGKKYRVNIINPYKFKIILEK